MKYPIARLEILKPLADVQRMLWMRSVQDIEGLIQQSLVEYHLVLLDVASPERRWLDVGSQDVAGVARWVNMA